MSSIITAAKRRRSLSACLELSRSDRLPGCFRRPRAATARRRISCPPIEVNPPKPVDRNRVEPRLNGLRGSAALRRAHDAATDACGAAVGRAGAARPRRQPPNILAGASTTVITAEEIARSPAQTVQEIIAQVPGVQLTSLFGGVNGAQTTVDLRGFGATRSLQYADPHQRPQGERHRSCRASISPRFRAIRSSASKSPRATAARCFTATTPWAASSTSSPRPASAARRWRRASRSAAGRSASARSQRRLPRMPGRGRRRSTATRSIPTDTASTTSSRSTTASAISATPRPTSRPT